MTNQISTEQIDKFRTQLLKLKQTLLREMSSHSGDLVIGDQDESTYINATTQTQIRNKQAKLINAIDLALLKIKHGTYGICEITDEQIPIKRLEILPYATCIVQSDRSLKKDL